MGGTGSKTEAFATSLSYFNDQEQLQIKSIFQNTCHNKKQLSKDDLCSLTKPYLSRAVSDNIHAYMVYLDPQDASVDASPEGFVIALAHILKGSLEEKVAAFIYMTCGTLDNEPSVQQISNLITNFCEGYRHSLESESANLSTWGFKLKELRKPELLTKSLLHGLVAKDGKLQCEMGDIDTTTTYNRDSIEKWLGRSALLLNIFNIVCHECFPISPVDSVGMQKFTKFPACVDYDSSKVESLLDLSSLIYLNSRIPHDLRQQWKLLYSSRLHGESFSTMYGRVINKGPTVLIIKDTKGYVFGGFASESWAANSKFYGSSHCFLFNLLPHLEAYYTSGINENFMYFNHGQETLPNGMGMGGQFEYCGLWIDQEFSKGHSKAEPRCTTYNSPQLSADPQFMVDTMEVWRVGLDLKKPEDQQASALGGKGSILDKDPGAKAMLTLIGKGPHSEGMREQDATADIPEEHELHHS